jgi:putative ABC transport system permease protein
VGLVLVEPASSAVAYDLARLHGVVRAEPDRVAPARLRHGHRSYRTTITGIAPASTMRLLLDARLQEVPLPPQGLAINQTLADLLEVKLGDSIRVEILQGARTQREVPVAALIGDLMGTPAFMHIDVLNALLGEGDAISGARLQLDSAARAAFLTQVKETPRVAAAVEIGPIIRNFRETSARNVLIFTTVLSILAGTIAVGVVYNNARIALAERAWELASLRVLGMTRGEVSGLLLGELALEVLVALPLGWLAGYWMSAFIVELIHPETFRIPLVILPRTYALASVVVLAAGVASALIVRRQIDRLDLVGVLKTRD